MLRVRRNLTPLWLMAVSACTAPLSAHAHGADTTRQSIQTIYNTQEAAASHLDADGQFLGYAPGFIAIDLQGRRSDLAQERQTARAVFATMRTYTGSATIQRITVSGDVATVRVREQDVATLLNPQTNRVVRVVYGATSVDTWKKGVRGWLLIHSQILSEHGSLNGEEASPVAAPSPTSLSKTFTTEGGNSY